jgi:hypothetical protein
MRDIVALQVYEDLPAVRDQVADKRWARAIIQGHADLHAVDRALQATDQGPRCGDIWLIDRDDQALSGCHA